MNANCVMANASEFVPYFLCQEMLQEYLIIFGGIFVSNIYLPTIAMTE